MHMTLPLKSDRQSPVFSPLTGKVNPDRCTIAHAHPVPAGCGPAAGHSLTGAAAPLAHRKTMLCPNKSTSRPVRTYLRVAAV